MSTLLIKNLNRKYKITQAEIETAIKNNVGMCQLVADKFNVDPVKVKKICEAYMSLLIIKKEGLK